MPGHKAPRAESGTKLLTLLGTLTGTSTSFLMMVRVKSICSTMPVSCTPPARVTRSPTTKGLPAWQRQQRVLRISGGSLLEHEAVQILTHPAA